MDTLPEKQDEHFIEVLKYTKQAMRRCIICLGG